MVRLAVLTLTNDNFLYTPLTLNLWSAWLTILVGLDVIWRLRNERVWKNTKVSSTTVIKIIMSSVFYYINTFSCISPISVNMDANNRL